MARKQRTPEVLRSASDHLHYEFTRFNSLADVVMSGVLGQGPLHDAALESFTLHARLLVHFLYSKDPQPDDVIAEDYFGELSQWLEKRPGKTGTLEMIHKRVAKEVAHLTYARLEVAPGDKPWPVDQIAVDINMAFKVFLEHVSKDRLSPKWESVKLVRWHLLLRPLDPTAN
jgi:hypothetical protein